MRTITRGLEFSSVSESIGSLFLLSRIFNCDRVGPDVILSLTGATMFKEDRYTGSLDQVLTAEAILARCPWLWAVNREWAGGMGSETGSLHTADSSVFTQEIDKSQDQRYDIFFYSVDHTIQRVRTVPKLENHYCNDEDEFQHSSRPNPKSEGETIAERIISVIHLPQERMLEYSADGSLVIPQIVIHIPGPVKWRKHYFIYELEGRAGPENLVPLFLECAPTFRPKWFK
ncbi:hypothetical protein KW785_02650 [Candidatus Parcubacteria bacterium]|nr:hypothetical protein [Candidatus Parcubacteria bacterium]